MSTPATDTDSKRQRTDQKATLTTAATPARHGLTLFQLELLYVIARDGPEKGTAIREELEELFDKRVHHGQIYPNLDDLVDLGLVDKSERDRRTNEYTLTADGRALVRSDAERRVSIAGAVDGGDA